MPALRAFIRGRAGAALRERESCSDLVQSACREVLADLPSFKCRDEAASRRWLYLTAERKIQDRVRHHARDRRDAARQQLLGDEDARVVDLYASFCTPSQVAIAREEMQRIEHALDQSPASYRDALRSRHVLGLTNADIARERPELQRELRAMFDAECSRIEANNVRPPIEDALSAGFDADRGGRTADRTRHLAELHEAWAFGGTPRGVGARRPRCRGESGECGYFWHFH